MTHRLLIASLAAAVTIAWAGSALAQKPRRQPPPPVIPVAETQAAQKQFEAGRYQAAVEAAKVALTKNEKYTPAMLVMAKSYYRLKKYEWVRTLWSMMQKAGASDAERAEMLQILAFMESEKDNTPQAIKLLLEATQAGPQNAVLWNNLGGHYLMAKNYRDATPALEKAVQLQPAFAKAHLNLGSAYRGNKDYVRALAAYQRALQIFPNYADAVYNLGILYVDAEQMPNLDTLARLNAALEYFNRYKQMLAAARQPLPPDLESSIADANDKIVKEQKRLERERQRLEREAKRAAQKAAQPAPAK